MQEQNKPLKRLQEKLQARIPQATLAVSTLPDCPSLKLWLLNADYPQWELNADQAADLMNEPPFWSFCWASGQVLANHLLENPALVKDKLVVDFGGGSGVVAAAAKMAGASKAINCDIDSDARLASECNAELNMVTIDTINSIDDIPHCDVITVADVFYDRENIPLLSVLQSRAKILLVADSRLRGQALPGMEIVAEAKSHTVPDLDESQEFRHVFIYKSQAS